ncbi:hypothetical protein JXL21_01755 [Candidatus Bathyarchaeota archaeon]|nr:hypothetical protein [Candidatus Bathyarchaeota archaeon]
MSWPTPKEFYERFKNDPEAARKASFQLGHELGLTLKQKHGIEGDGLDAVAEVLNAAMIVVRSEPSAVVEGDRVIKKDRGFCVIMRSALTLNLPWDWLDVNFAWPWMEGIVSVVRPGMRMSVQTSRSNGDQFCTHVFEAK